MRTFDDLAVARPPWIWLFKADNRGLESLAKRVSSKMKSVVVDSDRMETRETLFREFARALEFPTYFGGNWNAFTDCINDLSWISTKSIAVIVKNAPKLLVNAEPDEFSLFLRITSEAAAAFAGDQIHHAAMSFHLVLHTLPEFAHRLDRRLSTAGVATATLHIGP